MNSIETGNEPIKPNNAENLPDNDLPEFLRRQPGESAPDESASEAAPEIEPADANELENVINVINLVNDLNIELTPKAEEIWKELTDLIREMIGKEREKDGDKGKLDLLHDRTQFLAQQLKSEISELVVAESQELITKINKLTISTSDFDLDNQPEEFQRKNDELLDLFYEIIKESNKTSEEIGLNKLNKLNQRAENLYGRLNSEFNELMAQAPAAEVLAEPEKTENSGKAKAGIIEKFKKIREKLGQMKPEEKAALIKVIVSQTYKTVTSVLGVKFATDFLGLLVKKGDLYNYLKGRKEVKFTRKELETAMDNLLGEIEDRATAQTEADKVFEILEEQEPTGESAPPAGEAGEAEKVDIAVLQQELLDKIRNNPNISPAQKKDFEQQVQKIIDEQREATGVNAGARDEKIKQLTRAYIQNKISGWQIAKDGLNLALTASGLLALRGAMYAVTSLAERMQKAGRKHTREKLAERTPESKLSFILRDVMVTATRETVQGLTFTGKTETKEKKTGFQKSMDFVRAAGVLARGLGIGGTALKALSESGGRLTSEGFDNLLDAIKANDFSGAMEQSGENIITGAQHMAHIYTHPLETIKRGAQGISQLVKGSEQPVVIPVAGAGGVDADSIDVPPSPDQEGGFTPDVDESSPKIVVEPAVSPPPPEITPAADKPDHFAVIRDHLKTNDSVTSQGVVSKNGSVSQALGKTEWPDYMNAKVTVINPDGSKIANFDANLVHEGDQVFEVEHPDGTTEIIVNKTGTVVEAGESLAGRYDEIAKEFELNEIPQDVQDKFNLDKSQGGFHEWLNYEEAKVAREYWDAHPELHGAPGAVEPPATVELGDLEIVNYEAMEAVLGGLKSNDVDIDSVKITADDRGNLTVVVDYQSDEYKNADFKIAASDLKGMDSNTQQALIQDKIEVLIPEKIEVEAPPEEVEEPSEVDAELSALARDVSDNLGTTFTPETALALKNKDYLLIYERGNLKIGKGDGVNMITITISQDGTYSSSVRVFGAVESHGKKIELLNGDFDLKDSDGISESDVKQLFEEAKVKLDTIDALQAPPEAPPAEALSKKVELVFNAEYLKEPDPAERYQLLKAYCLAKSGQELVLPLADGRIIHLFILSGDGMQDLAYQIESAPNSDQITKTGSIKFLYEKDLSAFEELIGVEINEPAPLVTGPPPAEPGPAEPVPEPKLNEAPLADRVIDLPNGSRINFRYDAQGEVINYSNPGRMMLGTTGREYLTEDYWSKISASSAIPQAQKGIAVNIVETTSRSLMIQLSAYDEIKDNPDLSKEAEFLREVINKELNLVERQYGPGIINREVIEKIFNDERSPVKPGENFGQGVETGALPESYHASAIAETMVGTVYSTQFGKGLDCMSFVKQVGERSPAYQELQNYVDFCNNPHGKKLNFESFLEGKVLSYHEASWDEVKKEIGPGEYLVNFASKEGGLTYGPQSHGGILVVTQDAGGHKHFELLHASDVTVMPQGSKEPIPLHQLTLKIDGKEYRGRAIIDVFKLEYLEETSGTDGGAKIYSADLMRRLRLYGQNGIEIKPQLAADGSLRLGHVVKETDLDSYFAYNTDYGKSITALLLEKPPRV